MKTLDRHLSRHFLLFTCAAVAVFLGLFLLVEFLEKLRVLLKYRAAAEDALLFFAARLPWMASQVIPMASLLGTLLSLVILSRHSEITAYRAGGVSVRRLALPYLAWGLAFSLFSLFLQEVAAPGGAALAREVMELRIKKRPPTALLQADDLWLRLDSRILHVGHVAPAEERLLDVSLVEIEQWTVSRRIDAREAQWTPQGWVLRDVEDRRFDPEQGVRTERLPELRYPLSDGFEDFRIEDRDLREISWQSITRQIRRYRAQGLDTRELEVGLWSRTSLPFASLIMPLLGFPFALRTGRRGGASVGVALGVAIGFAYWLASAVLLSLGKAGTIPPPVAAWSGNLAFAVLGSGLLWRAERDR